MTEALQKNASREEKKDQVYWTILNAALVLDFRKGHQKWTLSELSRTTGVTRSLIYYYFGKDRMSILQEAIRFIGEEFFGLTPKRLQLWKDGKIATAVLITRAAIEQTPALGAFYLAHRFRPTELGESFRKLENQYVKKLSGFFPKLGPDQIRALYGLMFGLVFAPNLTEAAIDEAVRVAMLVGKRKSA